MPTSEIVARAGAGVPVAADAGNRRRRTVREIASKEQINPFYISRVLRLTLLAPEIVEAILDGRQLAEVTLPGLMEGVPVEWGENR